MRMSAMGDVAMTVPVIASVLTQHPDVHITMLSDPRFADMFAGLDRLTFVGVDKKNDYKGLLGIFKLFRHLRKNYKFDLFVDLHDVLRSQVLRTLYRLTGLKISVIDKGRAEKKALIAAAPSERKQLISSFERYRIAFEKAGLPTTISFNGLNIETDGYDQSVRYIGVAPFAQHAGKIYPLDKMKEVVKQLAQRPQTHIFLFGGGKKEKETMENWVSELSAEGLTNVESLVGKCKGLKEEMKKMKQCKVMISMDSANMHIASLVGTPVVSVWGATHPYAGFYGFNQNPANAVQLDMDCRPCSVFGNKPCKKGNYPCLNGIAPETIVDLSCEL